MELDISRVKPIAVRTMKRHSPWLLPVTILVTIFVWDGLTRWGNIPTYLLPAPAQVLRRLVETLADGSLLRNFGFTLLEVLLGLFSGSILATLLGYILSKSALLERVLSPYLVASQAIPVVAIAPLLIIWFGSSLYSKVLICALTVFFPVLVNTVVGLRSVPENLRDLMRSLEADPAETLRYLEIPAALPVFLGGLRIGATLSVIGAVVGEFVGSDRGLGFLINIGRGQFDTALVFVAIFALVGMALGLYGIVLLLERRFLRWQKRPEG